MGEQEVIQITLEGQQTDKNNNEVNLGHALSQGESVTLKRAGIPWCSASLDVVSKDDFVIRRKIWVCGIHRKP